MANLDEKVATIRAHYSGIFYSTACHEFPSMDSFTLKIVGNAVTHTQLLIPCLQYFSFKDAEFLDTLLLCYQEGKGTSLGGLSYCLSALGQIIKADFKRAKEDLEGLFAFFEINTGVKKRHPEAFIADIKEKYSPLLVAMEDVHLLLSKSVETYAREHAVDSDISILAVYYRMDYLLRRISSSQSGN